MHEGHEFPLLSQSPVQHQFGSIAACCRCRQELQNTPALQHVHAPPAAPRASRSLQQRKEFVNGVLV